MVLWIKSNALSEFAIVFHNNDVGAYFPGQLVNVRVNLVWTKPLEIRGIRLKVVGLAHVEWTEKRGRADVTFKETETLINELVTLWGKGEDETGTNPTMYPGSYEFIFSFNIPSNCPPNFEGEYGWIRYSCKAVIDIPWYSNEERIIQFTVLSSIDLNSIESVSYPRQTQETKELICFYGLCCFNGMLECTVNIHRCGFVPGEFVIINAQIENRSTKYVQEVNIRLLEIVSYKAEGRVRYDKTQVASVIKDGIAPGHSQIWSNERFLIPETRASVRTCSIIQLCHILQIQTVPRGCYSDFEVTFPIIVGNIRLRTADVWNNGDTTVDVESYL